MAINNTDTKTLSIIVPCYNSATTLKTCLDSLLVPHILEEIEVLIVNDGSKDGTASIAKEYEKKHSCFHLIDKENGGHGSVINVGAQLAKGKYIKILDSDDWFINFELFVNSIRLATADVVLTNFNTVDPNGDIIREYRARGLNWHTQYSFDNIWKQKESIKEVCNFHGITYRTEFYNSLNLKLSEGISYEDQEYATLPFANVQTVLPLDIALYMYQMGSPTQSVSPANISRQLTHLEHVFWQLYNYPVQNASASAKDYFAYKQSDMLLSCYMSAMVKSQNKKEGRAWAKNLKNTIKKRDTSLHRRSRFHYYTCAIISRIRLNSASLFNLQKFNIYKFFAKRMR